MAKVKDVISRIGLFTGSNEFNKVKKHNVRKILYFNHLNLYLHAPKLMADYYMKDTSLSLTAKSASYPAYLDLSSITDTIKEISAVSAPGQAAYIPAISREHFDNLVQYSEEDENGRYYLDLRGTDDVGGSGKILIFQGSNITSETTLLLQYVRQMKTAYVDDVAGSNDGDALDAPEQLLELLIRMCAHDVLMETGNKEGVKDMRLAIDEQKGLLSQLDAYRQTRSQALDAANRDK